MSHNQHFSQPTCLTTNISHSQHVSQPTFPTTFLRTNLLQSVSHNLSRILSNNLPHNLSHHLSHNLSSLRPSLRSRQVFGLQLNMELAAQMREKHILRTQTLLCDMLLRDAPIGIVSQSPNIADLVKCDGAALFYGGRFWLLGTTPTEEQVGDIASWLLQNHKDSTGLSTDSLADAGYPGAEALGEAICGMAAARITDKDFLFWFRSHAQKEIKWGGEKHDPSAGDDPRKMHPRSSFAAFLEVVKQRSLPWEDVEMDAIHSLQLILRGSFQDIDDSETKTMIHARLNDLKLQVRIDGAMNAWLQAR